MYKQVMLLGLLLDHPMYGQQIREVIESHTDLLADAIKKPTIYYQLDRLARDGYLEVRREEVEAPGPGQAHDDLALREREVYHITNAGRAQFHRLLCDVLRGYTASLSDLDAGLFFLDRLSPASAAALLEERRAAMHRYQATLVAQLAEQHAGDPTQDPAHDLVGDRLHALLAAELDWLDRTITRLRARPPLPSPAVDMPVPREPARHHISHGNANETGAHVRPSARPGTTRHSQ